MTRDKILILILLALAVAATVFAAWFRWSQGHRAQGFWGSDVAHPIRFAESVDLLWLEPPSGSRADTDSNPDAEMLTVDAVPWRVSRSREITDAPGLVHARQALIQDASFAWDTYLLGPESTWTHAMVFRSTGQQNVTVLFDLFDDSHGFVRELHGVVKLRLTIPQGFKAFFEEQAQPTDGGSQP